MLVLKNKNKNNQPNNNNKTLFFGAYFTISKMYSYPFISFDPLNKHVTTRFLSGSCSETLELLTQGLCG